MAKAKTAETRITPINLNNPEAHLHTSCGRCPMGYGINVPGDEAATYIEQDRAKECDESVPDYPDEAFLFAEGAPAVYGEGFAADQADQGDQGGGDEDENG